MAEPAKKKQEIDEPVLSPAWIAEIRRRCAELDADEAKTYSAEEVLAEARDLIQRHRKDG